MISTKETFGNKVRIRACGLCYKGDAILLVKHNIDNQILWAPPGGGVAYSESLENTIIREFKEETGLDVKPGNFLFFSEYISSPLHAIELFYNIESYSGHLIIGKDPELSENMIIEDVDFFNKQRLKQLDKDQLHIALKICNNPIDLLHIQGQIKYP